MDKIAIGKRIKNRRVALGLTQNQLTDGYITRNMLSLIESGSALPSLETAEFIAKKLEVPLSYLLADADEADRFERNELIIQIQNLFANGEYKQCLDIFEALNSYNNELNYIYAYAAFYHAKSRTLDGSFEEAILYLERSLKKCKETIYDTSMIEAAAPLYLSIATNVQSPLLELDTTEYENKHLAAFDYELYKYLTLDFEFSFSTPTFKTHLNAKLNIRKYRFYDAIKILKELEEANSTDYNAFVIFGVYSDLENCYKQIGDFENAYRYSSKKFNLLNALNK